MMVVGPRQDADGHRRVIIIDTLEDSTTSKDLAKQYLALYQQHYSQAKKLPIDAIIYTHNHIDHTGGVLGYLDEADKEPCPIQDPDVRGLGGSYTARRNCVEIICHEKVVDAVVNTSTVAGRIITARSFYMYGVDLKTETHEIRRTPLDLGEAITNGIGPYLSSGVSGFRLPSRTFADEMALTAAGVEMLLMYVPSETNDELAVFVPDALNGATACSNAEVCASGLLFSAEVIQGPSFPNLYSLRGTQYRSPATWYKSVDKLRQFDAWCMVPSHGPPVCQRENIQLLLTNFRDAVQFTHDQTVRFMNKGYKPDALAELVKVPAEIGRELSELVPWPNAGGSEAGSVHPEDYLLPFYGSVPQAVRETYAGYVGWFDGDPVHLSPTPPQVAARRLSELIGSGQDVVQAADAALKAGEHQWAAELATIAIRANPDDRKGLEIKKRAFMELGRRALNPNWSNWFFTAANELQYFARQPRKSSEDCFVSFLPIGLISPIIQAHVPVADWLASLAWQLDGRRAAKDGADSVMGFWIEPSKQDFGSEGYVIELRHGIAQFTSWKGTKAEFLDKVAVAVQMSQRTLDEILVARQVIGTVDNVTGASGAWLARFHSFVVEHKIPLLKGTTEDLSDFLQYFDPWPTCQSSLIVPQSPGDALTRREGVD